MRGTDRENEPVTGRDKHPILIYSLVFPPDGVSTAQLYGELAEDLARRGHHVSVISTTPHYVIDSVASGKQPLKRFAGGLIYRSRFAGITVWHTWHPAGPRYVWKRLLGWTLFHLLGLLLGLRIAVRGIVVLVPSPLLTAGLVGAMIARARSGTMIYNVQELYPDLAIRTGRIKSALVQRALFHLERAVYKAASAVTAITPGMRRKILEKGFPESKVLCIPNFVDLGFLKSSSKVNDFSMRFGLADPFVVSYAGNVGFSQDLNLLLSAAESLPTDNVVIALVGEGPSLPALRKQADDASLKNVRFIDQQPYETVPEIYGASDLCVVPLRGEVEGDALPSKVLRIMACGRPVLAICDRDSDLASLVRDAGAGYVVTERSGAEIAKVIRQALSDSTTLQSMGEAGRRYVTARFGRDRITEQYSTLVDAVGRERGTPGI